MGSEQSTPAPPPPTLLDQPWRHFPYLWDENTVSLLRREVERHQPCQGINVEKYRFLILGFVQSGKSSLYNSLNSACQDKIKFQAKAAPGTGSSLTREFRIYDFRNRLGEDLHFQFCDTMGAEIETGLTMEEARVLMGGHLPDRWKFGDNPSSATAGYISAPELGQKPHTLIIVIDINQVDILGDAQWSKLREIKSMAFQIDLIVTVVLTKVDQICPETKQDTEKVYRSIAVWRRVQAVSRKMGIQIAQILPVHNYVEETHPKLKMSILLLDTIRHILNQAEAQLEDKRDMASP